MHLSWCLIALISLSATNVASIPAVRTYGTHDYYVLEHIPHGAPLQDVAEALGVELVEQAGELRDHWLVRIEKPIGRLNTREEDFDPVTTAFESLQAKASSHLASRSEEALHAKRLVSSVPYLERQILRELVKRAPPPIRPPTPTSARGVAERLGLKDPLFTKQWHLINDEFPEHMMNTTPVWDMGLTGKGVYTSFLDDGLDDEADDLKDAFDADNSYDFNSHVKMPKPTGVRDHHGTRCAGQVAARRNDACGVGIAYDAKAAGVRILGGPISNVDEASALNYGYKQIDIYSCSWGPRDNGQTMEGPSYLIRKAVSNGIYNGRGGKGSIFVFASGNGGRDDDQCNFDGYTNSIYSVTVSSIDYMGKHPEYSETCAANMIVAYSSGSGNHIVTTDRGKNECSSYHGGTSAAAPNAVGVFALALQARPDLTWRDIQYLCVHTARRVNPDDSDWEKTASGRMYSYKYGYGALDAYAYVTAAKDWKLVKPQAWLHTEPVQIKGGKMAKKGKYEGGELIGSKGVTHSIAITKEMMEENNLESLEHIDVRVWIDHTKRGDVEVELVSPNGIKSVLAKRREYDEATTGYPGWRFMTIKHWGENAIGDWTIRVTDQDDKKQNGTFLGWTMALWGTTIDATKAKVFVEPQIDNFLPPNNDPIRPVPNDPDMTSTTLHPKPTDHSPPAPTSTEIPDDGESWYELVAAQKWFFAGLGAVSVFAIGVAIYFWRRHVARQKLANYTSLAADDIHMGAMAQDRIIAGSGGPRTTRALYDSFGAPSTDDLPERSAAPVNHPGARGTAGLGFHSGFLDDDEPSAGLTPKYRDEPEDTQSPDRQSRSEVRDDTPRTSRDGSRERLTG
ncbi:peptidase S8/S53 domain-containing protein [Crassisporium funariophilum]|nr:peptidase S8/S53 domain-containing protein [Crassisporium funariophilum]